MRAWLVGFVIGHGPVALAVGPPVNVDVVRVFGGSAAFAASRQLMLCNLHV